MKKQRTDEQIRQQYLENTKLEMERELEFCPEPSYFYEPGQVISYGAFNSIKIVSSAYDGKYYLIELTRTVLDDVGRYSREIKEVQEWRPWYLLRPISENRETLIQNEDCRLSFSNRCISDIMSKAYHFGIDFEPDYQRDFVWTQEDKEKLIDSIFCNIDIGKFCFIKNGYNDKYLYTVLDGKQRIRAILDFYENRFAYKGKYFNDLSPLDQNHFEHYMISVAEVNYADRKTILKYFLMLNTGGRIMAEEQLEKVRKLYEEETRC